MRVSNSQVVQFVGIRCRIDGGTGDGRQSSTIGGEVVVSVGPAGEVIYMVRVGGLFHRNVARERRYHAIVQRTALNGVARRILEGDGVTVQRVAVGGGVGGGAGHGNHLVVPSVEGVGVLRVRRTGRCAGVGRGLTVFHISRLQG